METKGAHLNQINTSNQETDHWDEILRLLKEDEDYSLFLNVSPNVSSDLHHTGKEFPLHQLPNIEDFRRDALGLQQDQNKDFQPPRFQWSVVSSLQPWIDSPQSSGICEDFGVKTSSVRGNRYFHYSDNNTLDWFKTGGNLADIVVPLAPLNNTEDQGSASNKKSLFSSERPSYCQDIVEPVDPTSVFAKNTRDHSSASEILEEESFNHDKSQIALAPGKGKKKRPRIQSEEKKRGGFPLKKVKRDRGPKFAFTMKSDVDVIVDGYKWRKYGQKAMKNSPYPRSYYKCTVKGCSVKKHVEQDVRDPSYIVIEYEGVHNHSSSEIINVVNHAPSSIPPVQTQSSTLPLGRNDLTIGAGTHETMQNVLFSMISCQTRESEDLIPCDL